MVCSNKDDTDLVRWHSLNAPVVEIVGELAVAWLEDEVTFHEAVLQDFSHVEYVEVVGLCEDEGVANELLHPCLIITFHEVIVGVGGVDLVVVWIIQH